MPIFSKKTTSLSIPNIEFRNVVFEYTKNKPILNNVSFSVFDNEYICVIGHNGCGKSTISKLLMGLLKPKSGNIYLFGHDIHNMSIKSLRNNVGIVFQNPDNQFIGFSAEDDIAFGLENHKVDPTLMWGIINKVAKVVNISSVLKKDVNLLSAGQKQRVIIASTLAIDPKIIVFDEATSMLDPKAKIILKKLMLSLKNDYHKTIISITHDMDEVVNADRVIVMNKGQIIDIGKPKEIFSKNSQLEQLSLEYPFVFKLSKKLKEIYPEINETFDLNSLLKEINNVR